MTTTTTTSTANNSSDHPVGTTTAIPPSEGVVAFDETVTYAPYKPGGRIVVGTCAKGWESVRDAFGENFAKGLERGAQLCIMDGPDVVLDMYGVGVEGVETKPPDALYTFDTVQSIWSSGKNIEAIVIAMLVDRGWIEYQDPISKHWPNFANAGKANITIADLMRHSAGMAYFLNPEFNEEEEQEEKESSDDTKSKDTTTNEKSKKYNYLTLEDIQDRERMHRLMERTPPQQFGPTKRTYHAITRGFVVDGIVKHVDPSGRTIGQFVHDEILVPLSLTDQYVIAFKPGETIHTRVKSVGYVKKAPMMYDMCHVFGPALLGIGNPSAARLIRTMGDPTKEPNPATSGLDWKDANMIDSVTKKMDPYLINDNTRMLQTEGTSAFSLANARALSQTLSVFANGGRVGNVQLFSKETAQKALSEIVRELDSVMNMKFGFTQGGLADLASIQDPDGASGQNRECWKGFYGWGGYGGSINICNPENHITISYAMTAMGALVLGDERTNRIMKAVSDILK